MKKVGIKLCGNCNPDFEVKEVLALLRETTPFIFVPADDPESVLTLYLNSCISSCNRGSGQNRHEVIVKGLTFREKRFADVDALVKEIGKVLQEELSQ